MRDTLLRMITAALQVAWYLGFPLALFGVSWASLFFAIRTLPILASGVVALFFFVVSIYFAGASLRNLRPVDGMSESYMRVHKEVVKKWDVAFGNIAASITSILILATVWAWVSYALIELNFITDFTGSAEANYNQIVSTYIWHVVDLIPFMNLEASAGMSDPPVQFSGWMAGSPILVFRVLVIVIVSTVLLGFWKAFWESS